MPNIKSAKKRVLVNAKKALRNKSAKQNLRTSLKNASIALEANTDNTADQIHATIKTIDKAVAKGLLHKNTAARRKSKLVLKLNKIGA